MLNTKRLSYLILLFLVVTVLMAANIATAATLTVSKIGSGGGTIFSDPTGTIDCGATCSAAYTSGDFVILEYNPDFVSEFVTWGGDAASCGTNWQCSFSITADMTVTAEFSRAAAVSLPLFETFETYDTTPLNWKSRDNNDPSPSSSNKWDFFDECGQGNLTGGGSYYGIAESSCWGVMDTELITPEFTTVGISKVAFQFKTDLKSSASTTADIDVSVNQGATWTTVWTKAGVSLRGPARVTLDISSVAANQSSVIARFHYRDDNSTGGGWWEVDDVKIAEYPALTVAKSGTGAGSVVSAVAGISCDLSNTDCSEIYIPDSVVTLRAIPESGSYFAGWSGTGATLCTGQALVCLVTMDAAKTVTASFTTGAPAASTWLRTYGGTDWDSVLAGQQTMDGGYLVSGHSYSYTTYGSMAVLKTDATGSVVWQQFIDQTPGPAMEILSSMKQTADGGYIATSLYPGLSLIKLDSSGGITWQKFYNGPVQTSIYSVQQTSDGGYIMTGYDYSSPSVQDVLVVKTDLYGNLEWQKRFGGAGYNQGNSIQQTADGGYVLTGVMFSVTTLNDIIVIKLDASGNVAWQKTYGDAGDDSGFFIRQAVDGEYVLTGQIYSPVSQRANLAVLKLNGSGVVQWRKILDYPGYNSYGYSIDQSADGGYIVGGGANDPLGGASQALLVKLKDDGSLLWSKGFPKTTVNVVQQAADGGYFVAGDSYVSSNGHMVAIKTDANGDTPGCLAGYNATLTEVTQTVMETSTAYVAANPALSPAIFTVASSTGTMSPADACSASVNAPPAAPILSSPADAGTVSAWGLTLSWYASTDPDSWDSVSYDLYLDTSPTPTTVQAASLGGVSFTPALQKGSTYYWKVTAKDTHGGTAESSIFSFTTSANQPPLVSAQTYTTYADTCSNPYYAYFNTSDPDGTIVKYEWDLNGDSVYDVTTTTPDIIFNTPGTYTLTLRVTDNDGGTAVATMDPAFPVIVSSTLQADFVMNHIMGQAPLAVNFADRTNAGASCAGISEYAWDFGDGTPIVHSTNPTNPSHVFSTAGSYTVTLTVTETTGNQVAKTIASAVDVYNAPATPNLYVNGAVAASGDGLTPATAFKTIQEGINTAATGTSQGTVILVTQGTYTANLWLPDTQIKAFVLEGGWDSGFTSRNTDPSLTVINGNASGSVVSFNYYMPEKTRVDISGFTLTNGSGQYTSGYYGPYYEGGGIYANITAGLLELNLTGNAIVNNSVPDGALYSPSQGAGIFVNSIGGPVNISQNTISNNRFSPASTSVQAGGLEVTGSAWVDAQGNTVTNNDREGAYYSALWNHSANNTYSANETGVYAYGSLVSSGDTINGNLLNGMKVSGYNGNVNIDHAAITNSGGDGIYLDASFSQNGLTVVDSAITDNTGHGINIYNESSDIKARIERTRLINNSGSGFSMDLYNSEGDPVVDLSMVNSVAANNGASGVDLATGNSSSQSLVKIVNSTLTGNAVKGVNVSGSSNPPFDISVFNSILWGNYEWDLYTTVGNVSASYSDIGTRTTAVDSIYTDQGGNISADPLLAGDYQLTSGSPAIDTGAASGLGLLAPVLDLNSQARPQGAGYDMGAFEYVAAPDTTPPTAVSATPLNGTTNVPTNTLIAATFSENMLVSSITSTTFLVTGPAGTVPGSIITSGPTATFTPSSALASGTIYTATITTGAQDLAGNAMAANYTWSFTTLITAHTITASAGPYGTIAPSGAIVVSDGGSQAFTVLPNPGYSVATVTVDLVSQGSITTYTFTNVTADHTISASFADITSPAGTITINGGASYTNTLGVTLGLTCSDSGSGCSQVEVSNFSSFSPSTVWSAATTTTVSWTLTAGDGLKSVYAKYTDVDANPALSVIGLITLDVTPPATAATPPAGTYSSDRTVALSCTDGLGSGCGVIRYTLDGSDPILSSPSYTAPVLVSGPATTLKFFAVDLAGNAETVRTAVYTIDTSQPLVTLLTPTTNGYFNTAAVDYSLNKDMAVGQISFIRTGGAADPSSPHYYTMTGTDLLTGVHTANTDFGNLVDGTVYTITVDVTDSAARNTIASSTNVTFDSTATVAAITSPLSGGRVSTATVTYTLSETVMAGDIVIDDGVTQRVYSLTGSQLTSGSHTVDTGFTNSLVDGTVYTFSLANVVDLAGTPTTTVAVPNVTFDRTAVVITNTTPATRSIIMTPQAGYTLSEQAASGTITFTRSGGNPDPASPHVYSITLASDLTPGVPHTLTPSFTLVDGTFYTVSFAATDVVGNPATTVSNALIFFDSTYDPALPGNVDNTGSSSNLVNNADVLKLEQALGTRPGDRKWNPVCDLDRNNVVDTRDLMILHSHYGQTGP